MWDFIIEKSLLLLAIAPVVTCIAVWVDGSLW
jgi:hypothetical protein